MLRSYELVLFFLIFNVFCDFLLSFSLISFDKNSNLHVEQAATNFGVFDNNPLSLSVNIIFLSHKNGPRGGSGFGMKSVHF